MTAQEILKEIHKLPPKEQERIVESVLENRADDKSIFDIIQAKLIEFRERDIKSGERLKPEKKEKQFAHYLFARGAISHIPEGMSDKDDDFEPIVIEGEPLSETIIRERR
jgi:hypothetical protein